MCTCYYTVTATTALQRNAVIRAIIHTRQFNFESLTLDSLNFDRSASRSLCPNCLTSSFLCTLLVALDSFHRGNDRALRLAERHGTIPQLDPEDADAAEAEWQSTLYYSTLKSKLVEPGLQEGRYDFSYRLRHHAFQDAHISKHAFCRE